MLTFLLDGLWLGALIVAIAWIASSLVPRTQPATRYALWLCALGAIVVLPLMRQVQLPLATPVLIPLGRGTALTVHVVASAVFDARMWMYAFWGAGALAGVLRLALDAVRLDAIVRRAKPLPHLGANVMCSDEVTAPLAVGIHKPVIVVPQSYLGVLHADDLRFIVAHEAAHIARHDITVNAIARVLQAVFFFNPWIHIVVYRLICEREAACDAVAVDANDRAYEYATLLTNLALQQRRTHSLLTPSVLGSGRMLVNRVARLLDGKADMKVHVLPVALSIAAFCALTALSQFSTADSAYAASSGTTSTASTCNVPAKALRPAMPQISDATLKGHAGARADALVTVGADGRPQSAEISKTSGVAEIDKATIDAAMHSTYSPARHDCTAVVGKYLFHIELGP